MILITKNSSIQNKNKQIHTSKTKHTITTNHKQNKNLFLSLTKKLHVILTLLILSTSTNKVLSQNDFEMENINYNNNNNYNENFNNDFIDERMEMPQQRMGGAHPGFRNVEPEGQHFGAAGAGMNRRFNQHPGMMPEMMGGAHHRQGHRNFPNNNGKRPNNFQNNHQQQIHSSNSNNNINQNSGPFGIFNSSLANSLYEILMMVFLLGFLYNCFCGKNANDKYALAWYNANKQYFEERYAELGINNSEEGETIETDSLPIIKDSPYLYKFYAAGYRYIKWLLVVLEFRKRQDTISLFTSFLFPSKDRIIFEVGIEPAEDNVSWIFCVCNRRDVNTLKKDHQDIEFFCNTSEPSIMSDRLVLLSESDELYCELFQNKVKIIFFIFFILFDVFNFLFFKFFALFKKQINFFV